MLTNLHILTGRRADEVLTVPLETDITVGRDPACTLVVDGPNVSRVHAVFRLSDAGLRVENRSHVNAVYVNGVRCEGADLKRWDMVVIGPMVVRVEEPDERPGSEHALFACMLAITRLLNEGGDDLIRRCLEALFIALPVSRLAWFTIDDRGELVQGTTLRRDGLVQERLSHGFARQVLAAGRAILLEGGNRNEAQADWNATLQIQAVRTVLGAPVLVQQHPVAVLLGDNLDDPAALSRTHLQVMTWAAHILEQILQRDELQRLERERMRSEYEYEAGRAVQLHLFNKDPSVIPHPWRWRAQYRPALVLGGDFFDVVHDELGNVQWVVADVCGKGIPAALIASMLKVGCKALGRERTGPRDLLLGLHHLLLGEVKAPMYFTALALMATADGVLRWANAGHPEGLILHRDGTLTALSAAPAMLGLMPEPLVQRNVQEHRMQLLPGDRICLFTDGISEAMDTGEVQFGVERIRAVLESQAQASLGELETVLLDAVSAHCHGRFDDDITLVLGEYAP